jgi:antitoxin component YwqK of YwqJK toxin-antitoxin module
MEIKNTRSINLIKNFMENFRNGMKMVRKKNEINYHMDKIYGICRSWNIAGQILSESDYCDDRLHGKHKLWYENGQKMCDSNWMNGFRHGKYEVWYSNGQKKWECVYRMNDIHGIYNEWDKEGKLFFSEDYVLGYKKKHLLIILRTFRKAKWIRLEKLTKTKSFNEW